MRDDVRSVEMDMDLDEVRWGLAGVEVYQCPRCDFRCRAMFEGCPVEDEPILACAVCYMTRQRMVKLQLVLPPNPKNG